MIQKAASFSWLIFVWLIYCARAHKCYFYWPLFAHRASFRLGICNCVRLSVSSPTPVHHASFFLPLPSSPQFRSLFSSSELRESRWYFACAACLSRPSFLPLAFLLLSEPLSSLAGDLFQGSGGGYIFGCSAHLKEFTNVKVVNLT